MKAVVVTPGEKNSARLEEVEEPKVGEHQLLVKVLQVGIDGTDLEINEGLYGEPPPGKSGLIIGHEAVGEVVGVGPVVEEIKEGDLVVPTVRRPCPVGCLNCKADEPDSCLLHNYSERGIKGYDGYLCEYFVEFEKNLLKIELGEKLIGVLIEPLSVVEKAMSQLEVIEKRLRCEPKTALVLGAGPIGIFATVLLRQKGMETYSMATRPKESKKAKIIEEIGAIYLKADENSLKELPNKLGNIDIIIECTGDSSLTFQAMGILGANGVMALLGVSAGNKIFKICADCINLELVSGNKAIFGSVSSNAKHFQTAINDVLRINMRWPNLMGKTITRRFSLDQFGQALKKDRNEIKTVIEIS